MQSEIVVTDRNGRAITRVKVYGNNTDDTMSRRLKIWDRLRKDYPDAYIFSTPPK